MKMRKLIVRRDTSSCAFISNRSHVAVRLLSNRSKMESKYDENIKVAHEPLDILTSFYILKKQNHNNVIYTAVLQ